MKVMENQTAEQPGQERKETPSAPYQPAYNYQMPYPAYGYQPNYYYYPQLRRRTNPVIAVGFWIFYALVGFWVDFALTISFWACAIALPLTLPLVALRYYGWAPDGIGYTSQSWFGEQSAATLFSMAGATTAFGIILLILAIFSIKPWVKLHRFFFRELGGLPL
jgi:hypothetical protein